jgi:hypothetical protein
MKEGIDCGGKGNEGGKKWSVEGNKQMERRNGLLGEGNRRRNGLWMEGNRKKDGIDS